MSTKKLTIIAMYAALIFIAIQSFRIPTGGTQFVHFGNAFIVVGAMLFGAVNGAIAATLGVVIFDVLNNYASEAWLTALEAVILCIVVACVFRGLFRGKVTMASLVTTAVAGGLIKVVMNVAKYTFWRGMFLGGLPFEAAFTASLGRITGTYGTSMLIIIAVPILYPIFKQITNRLQLTSL